MFTNLRGRRIGASWVAAFSMLHAAQCAPVSAITIVAQYVEEDTPSFDLGGDGLMAIANAAADIWEAFYPASSDVYEIDFSWSNLDDDTLGLWTPQFGGDNNIRLDTFDQTGSLRNWFFDLTPMMNEEFTLVTTSFAANPAGFTGALPSVLEVGFRGGTSATPGGASGAFDLLSVVLHEIGHELGINSADPFEGDWDINDAHIGGLTGAVLNTGGHTAPPQTLMFASTSVATRTLPSATDILLVADDQGFNTVDLPRRDFIGGTDYNTGLNWIGGVVPDNDTDAFIRPTVAANVTMSGNNTTGNLTIDNGSTLNTQGNLLAVTNAMTVMPGATLNVGAGGVVTSGALNLSGTTMSVATNGLAEGDTVTLAGANVVLSGANLLYDTLTIDAASTISGRGSVGQQFIPLSTSLVNEGTIRPNGGTMTIYGDPNVATLDLDGTSGAGRIDATAGSLDVRGRILGQFASDIDIGPNQSVDFEDGWTLATNGNLDLNGAPGAPATLAGGTFAGQRHALLLGNVNVSGNALISADVQIFNNANVNIPNAADTLNITGFAEYQAAVITGAAGTLRQSGDARITSAPILQTTTISTNVFDMDGTTEAFSEIEIEENARLHVLSNRIEIGDPAVDGYDGDLNVRGALQVDTSTEWRLDGAMHMGAGSNVAGSPIRLHGTIDTALGAHGEAIVFAPLNLQFPYVLNPSSVGDTLVLAGTTTVRGGGTVTGSGDLRQVGDLVVDAFFTVPAAIDYDWDGDEASPSNTTVNAPNILTLRADTLETAPVEADGYDGTISLNGATLEVSTPGPWRLDGALEMTGLFPGLTGSAAMHLYGTIRTTTGGVLDAPVIMFPGSMYVVGGPSNIVQEPIEFAGGDVQGSSPSAVLLQRANANVTGDSEITIASYDWDGFESAPSGTTAVAGGTLALNVDTIDPDDAAYDGHLDLDGGRVIVNLAGGASWRLDGRIDVGNDGLAVGSVDGSKIISHGTIAAQGIGRIDADLEVTDAGVLRVDNPTDTLILTGFTTYRTLAAFAGTGRLIQVGDALVSGPTDTDGVNVGVYDMDGSESGPSNMTILFSGLFGSDEAFIINADQIEAGDPAADGFDGTLSLTQYVLEVNTALPWRLDGTLELVSVGGNLPRVRGSDIEVHGAIDPVGDGRLQAAVHFKPTATVNVEAGEVLHFDNPVTYEGGTYAGLGMLEHNADIRVIGNTSIDVAVFDIDGSVESTGVKIETGSLILNVNQLDVADNVFDGALVVASNFIVNTPMPWTSNGEVRVVSTGTIAGAPLVSNGPLVGAGLIKTDGLTNNGGIFADDGTLNLAPAALDLDGTSDASSIEANNGDLLISQTSPTFRGTATVGLGRRLTFVEGWVAEGILNLNGDSDFANRSIVDGGLSQFGTGNTTNVTRKAEIAAAAEFHTGTTVNLPDDAATLYLGGDAMISAGAQFIGRGTLVNQPGSTLSAEDGTSLGVALQNQGVFQPGDSAGQVRMPSFEQQTGGTLEIEIGGIVPGDEFDQLLVGDAANLGGELIVALIRGFDPDPRDTFTILSAAALSGVFDNVAHRARIDTLGGEGSFVVTYDTRANLVTLSEFLLNVLLGDYNNNGIVDAADYTVWRDTLGSTTNLAADGDGDGMVTQLDYDFWKSHFGNTASTGSAPGPQSPAGVPEPNSAVVLLMGGILLAFGRRSGQNGP